MTKRICFYKNDLKSAKSTVFGRMVPKNRISSSTNSTVFRRCPKEYALRVSVDRSAIIKSKSTGEQETHRLKSNRIASFPDPFEKKGVWYIVSSDYSLYTSVSKGSATQAASRKCAYLFILAGLANPTEAFKVYNGQRSAWCKFILIINAMFSSTSKF